MESTLCVIIIDRYFVDIINRKLAKEALLASQMEQLNQLQQQQESLSISGSSFSETKEPTSILSAKGAVWELSMSSKYDAITNTYKSLISSDYQFPGAATGSEYANGSEWIQATFKYPVLVTRVKVSSPIQGAFEDNGFSEEHLTYSKLQYSTDGKQWKTVYNCSDLSGASAPAIISLPTKISARYWRLQSENQDVDGVATGTFIFE